MLNKFKQFYWSIVPHRLRPKELWYRFKCWAWYRYSTVKPKTLPNTWVDRCELLPHIMFQVLSDFLEKECGKNCHVEWYGEHPHLVKVNGKMVNVRDEMQDLYDWWHNDYLINRDHIYDAWHEHREKHVKDIFTPIERDLEGWTTEYSKPEEEKESNRLFAEASAREEFYCLELKRRLHRVVNVIPYMWT